MASPNVKSAKAFWAATVEWCAVCCSTDLLMQTSTLFPGARDLQSCQQMGKDEEVIIEGLKSLLREA